MNGVKPRRFVLRAALVLGGAAAAACAPDRGPVFAPAEPLALHPDNPHYFVYKGRPTVLVTSGEHWGAVLNLDFDYVRYLDTLAAAGLNYTRVFSGTLSYRPDPARPDGDTQAPRPGRLITPWPRAAGAGLDPDTFDLERWDEDYFRRLRDFVRAAAQRDVIVEYVFFRRANERKSYVSPLHASFNVNGVGRVDWPQLDLVSEPSLLEAQRALVRKVAAELRGFPNVFYDIAHASNDTEAGLDWQDRMVAALVEAESDGAPRHLIAANLGNDAALGRMHRARSVLLGYFPRSDHELGALDLLERYFHLGLPIGMGKDFGLASASAELMTPDEVRVTAWETLLAGGALYNNKNLDYTVTDPTADTGASREARRALAHLRRFLTELDLVKLAPRPDLVRGGVPAGASARLLAEPGRQYAFYVHHAQRGGFEGTRLLPRSGARSLTLTLELAPGTYRAEWIDPATLAVRAAESFEHPGGPRSLASPPYTLDLALRVR